MGVHDGRLKVQLAAPPADGLANRALKRLLSSILSVPTAQIELVSGASSRKKNLRLSGLSYQAVWYKLSPNEGV